jgi:hypothetical protein
MERISNKNVYLALFNINFGEAQLFIKERRPFNPLFSSGSLLQAPRTII